MAQSTDLGRIASHYYVSYHTLATYNDHMRVTMGDIELLRLFALSDEFRYMVVCPTFMQSVLVFILFPISLNESRMQDWHCRMISYPLLLAA